MLFQKIGGRLGVFILYYASHYAPYPTFAGKVVKIELSTFTQADVLTLGSGDHKLYGAQIWGTDAYIMRNTAPGR